MVAQVSKMNLLAQLKVDGESVWFKVILVLWHFGLDAHATHQLGILADMQWKVLIYNLKVAQHFLLFFEGKDVLLAPDIHWSNLLVEYILHRTRQLSKATNIQSRRSGLVLIKIVAVTVVSALFDSFLFAFHLYALLHFNFQALVLQLQFLRVSVFVSELRLKIS